jgi:hypothetical protein
MQTYEPTELRSRVVLYVAKSNADTGAAAAGSYSQSRITLNMLLLRTR